jgi:hypothetical protein
LGSAARANPVHGAHPALLAQKLFRLECSFGQPIDRGGRRLQDRMMNRFARDHDNRLRVLSDSKFGVIEETVNNIEMAFDTIVDQIGFAILVANE